MAEHIVCAVGGGKDFAFFNMGDLSMEEVSASDLVLVEVVKTSPFRSMAWSCNCSWYFVLSTEGIALLNVHSLTGYLCRKRSQRFVEMFLDGALIPTTPGEIARPS